MKFAVCFCVHAGDLEIKAMLLAASLRKYWPATVELIACVPVAPEFGGVSQDCAQTLRSLDARFEKIRNPFGAAHPIANKISCLEVATDAERLVFLDTDILAVSAVNAGELQMTFGRDFVAKPADKNTSTLDKEGWQRVYGSCGLTSPQFSVKATATGESMEPYYNSGVLAINANSDFGRLWSFYFKKVARLRSDLARLHVFDQIPLSLAVNKAGYRVRLLDQDWNYPTHLQPLGSQLPKLCHYHWPRVISQEPSLIQLVSDLTTTAPHIFDAMRTNHLWTPVVDMVETPRPKEQDTPRSSLSH